METASTESQQLRQNAPHSSGEPSSEMNTPSAAFSPNKINTLVLPLVTDSQRLIWIPSGHISLELDVAAVLDKAFDRCPYLTQTQTAALARSCSLHPDQVKMWFMVQRIRCGISWDREDILKIQMELKSRQGKEELERDRRVKFRHSVRGGTMMRENVVPDQQLEGKMKQTHTKDTATYTKEEPDSDKEKKKKLTEEKTATVEDNTHSQVLDEKQNEERPEVPPKPSGAFTSTYKYKQRRKMSNPADPYSCSRVRLSNKTQEQMGIMKMAFLHCLYPDREDYDQLMRLTGVPRSTLVQWYGDMRYQLKKKKPRWMTEDQYNEAVATIRYQQFLNKFAKGLQGKRKRASGERNKNRGVSQGENENVSALAPPEQK